MIITLKKIYGTRNWHKLFHILSHFNYCTYFKIVITDLKNTSVIKIVEAANLLKRKDDFLAKIGVVL